MRSILYLFLPLLLQLPLISIAQVKCDLVGNYGDFVKVQRFFDEGRPFVSTQIIEPTPGRCYSEVIGKDERFLDFLVINYSSNEVYQGLRDMEDSVAMNQLYIQRLQNDSLFNSVMQAYSDRMLSKVTAKDTVSMDGLLNVAVKFFSINKIDPNGKYSLNICVGKNDIKKTQVRAEPFVEAFCFSAIFEDTDTMFEEFKSAIMKIKKVDLGNDPQEKLLRAQGATYLLMRESEGLRKQLLSEYERWKEYLPFVLIKE